MEQQAKERLTGGVILVVLLVLLVPELLTGPRPPPAVVPAQPDQAPMRSYTLDLGESPRANSAPVAASTTVPPASDPMARTPVSSAPSLATPAPAVPVPTPDAARRAASAPEPTTAVNRAHPHAATVPAPATHTLVTTKHTEHSATGWTVQLGTFSSRDNAAHLLASLKSHGFSASLSEATHGGRKLYRVRVGAERDRASAQKLQARLRAAGEKGGEVVSR